MAASRTVAAAIGIATAQFGGSMTSTLATASNGAARENGVVDTVLVPFTTAEIGGSHISGILLAAGLAERFGVRD